MQNYEFTTGDFVVYPAHGVGKLIGIETHEVNNNAIELFVINFDRERMTLRLPINKAKAAGLRPLSSLNEMQEALSNLSTKTRQKKVMWSKRAQEYETKINSGKPELLSEVVKELYRNPNDSGQSYSERQIYQVAMNRLVREYAAVKSIDEQTAVTEIEKILDAA